MLKKIISLFLFLSLVLSLASCVGASKKPSDYESVEDIPLPEYKKGQTVSLKVYNWGEYISDGSEDSFDVNKEFEKYFNEHLSEKYGGIKIKVEYSMYPTNEEMYSKITNGAVSYDVIIPSDYMIQKMQSEGLLLSFDTGSLSNYGNISEDFKGTYYDPDNRYSVPYTYGMLGIIYNKDKVDPEDVADKSWALMWNEKYSGNILQFNNPRDAFATAMYKEGLSVNSDDPEVWNKALLELQKQKPILQGYVNDEIFNKMENESALIASYYVGDFLTMADNQENLAFYYPKEGVNYFIDAMCIPSCSSNPHLAKEYINFMISEEAAVANALYIGYASPNTAVVENEEYIEAMLEYSYEGENGENAYELLYNNTPDTVNAYYNSLFPDEIDPACYRSFSDETQKNINALWESLKKSSTTEPWIHVVSGLIVASVLTLEVYSTYTKKKRSHSYRLRDKQKKKTA